VTSLSRRRFLTGLIAGVGAGAAGVAAWSIRGSGQVEASVTTTSQSSATSPSSTTAAPTTAAPATTSSSTTTSTTTTAAPVAAVAVICRAAWGALPVAGEFTSHQIDQVTIHHTAVLLEDNADAPGRVRQHQAYHQSLGWPDLAYHYMIDADGNVYEGRPVGAVGDTATEYDPTGHLLVCCEGNFDEQDVPQAQYETLVRMVAWGCGEFGVDPASVRGHRDVASTTCPGDDLYAYIASGALADDVAALAGDPLQLELVCGDKAREMVELIETA
jgi:hypothetical protein